MSRTLIVDLQTRDYKETWKLQLSLVELRAQALVPDVLLLVEHPHVVTIGTSGKPENILSKRFPMYEVERGGDVTYHGFGQLVGYPIIDLTPRDKKVGRYVRDLEAMLIETLDHFGISAQRIEGRTGVWIGDHKKIASIGVAVRSWITFHGFALNVSTDLSCFSTVNPCGYESGVMTSITEQLGRPVSISAVKGPIVNAFEHVFATKLEPASEEKLTRLVRPDVPAKT
jgi:lipoate-protein ligase B